MSERSNWANNYNYAAPVLAEPASVEELRDLIVSHDRVRALGTRHSFNDIADTSGVQISTAKLSRIWPVDQGSGTVMVESGVTYGMLCRELDQQGYSLRNMASLPHITVAGACATATHGSGELNGILATSVVWIELVHADGSVVEYSQSDMFDGVVVGLGATGIVSRLRLKLAPSCEASQVVYLDLPLKTALERFDEIQALGYSVSLFTGWQNDRINQVWIKRKDADRSEFPTALFGAKEAACNLHPIETMYPEPCTEQRGIPGRWYERLPHFKLEFTPSAAIELQAEYFVRRDRACAALEAVNDMGSAIAPLLQVSEIRTIAADRYWLSPCFRQDCVSIHFTWFQKQREVEELLVDLERVLEPFEARPHWGKLFMMDKHRLSKLYTRMPDFVKMIWRLDPGRKFSNEYVERCLGE